ncbi:unnamed protein product, partial [Nesidiocoris tenuis]
MILRPRWRSNEEDNLKTIQLIISTGRILKIFSNRANSGGGMDGVRDVMHLLEERVAMLTGGRDRRGGALLMFPTSARRDRLKPDDYHRLIKYLVSIPTDEVRETGFTVIVDMRGAGSTWGVVKPILKVLHDHLSSVVHAAYIIKPDNFWQKQRTSLGSHKYKFEVNLISMEGLPKVVDSSQLTPDLDGTLHYDHSQWIDLRLAVEDFMLQAVDLLDQLDDIQEDLARNDYGEDVASSKNGLEIHAAMKKRIMKAPVEEVDVSGQRLLQKLTGDTSSGYDSGYSGRDSEASTTNPDLQAAVPQILNHLDSIRSTQGHLLQLWQHKKLKLDQCYQLRLFEQDCEKQNVYVNIKRILAVAHRMMEVGHYAAAHIRTVANRLDRAWKEFAAGLDERTAVLALSVLFHHKAEQVYNSYQSLLNGLDLLVQVCLEFPPPPSSPPHVRYAVSPVI